jgi:ribosome biogenesis protein SSF1/2
MIFIYVTVAKESVGKEEVTEEEVEGQEETEDGSEDEMEE